MYARLLTVTLDTLRISICWMYYWGWMVKIVFSLSKLSSAMTGTSQSTLLWMIGLIPPTSTPLLRLDKGSRRLGFFLLFLLIRMHRVKILNEKFGYARSLLSLAPVRQAAVQNQDFSFNFGMQTCHHGLKFCNWKNWFVCQNQSQIMENSNPIEKDSESAFLDQSAGQPANSLTTKIEHQNICEKKY